MKSASQALSTWNPGALTDRQPLPTEWVERIFTRLEAQLGAKLLDLYANADNDAVKAEWAEALSGFDPSEILRGIQGCQTRVFAPTLGEFLRLCRPALNPEIAWLEAHDGMFQRERGHVGDWSHPAVYRAAHQMAFELRAGSFKEHRKRWEWLLDREFRKGWLLGVPQPMTALGHAANAGTRPPTEEERQKLASIRAEILPAPTKPGEEKA